MTTDGPYFGSAIGPIVSAFDVEAAALATLKKWSSHYLAECEAQHGRVRGSLPRVRSYTTANSFDKWPEDQLPCVLLVSPGTAQPPEVEGNGRYRAFFSLGIAAIVSTRDMVETEEVAKLYVAALRTCLVQQRSLGGFAAGVEWLDETYDDLPSDDARSLGAGQAIFTIEVSDISRRYAGPKEPPEPDIDPDPDDPDATDVAVSVVPLPIP
jgi:hypothetical protein